MCAQAPHADLRDALYAQRANLADAKRAADLWRTDMRHGAASAFESAWKLARADYWIGGHATAAERRAVYDDGIAAARTAVSLQPNRPEGHFWLAANMGAMAESAGLRAGIRYRRPIKDALETVLRLDPAFLQGSADRALGRWYHRVPSLFGGSHRLAEAHLRASLEYDPASTASHFFLAELYLDDDRRAEGRAELQAVLDAPVTADWGPEDREFKDRARKALADLK